MRSSAQSQSPLGKLSDLRNLRESALDKTGSFVGQNGTSPHQLYRYPARFSPRFAGAAVRLLTQPGDLVLDPFMGSGTTIIESIRHGRNAIGIDVSPISNFLVSSLLVSSKTRRLDEFEKWFIRRVDEFRRRILHLRIAEDLPTDNLKVRESWRHLRLISALIESAEVQSPTHARLTRQVLLRASQWAFDLRTSTPTFGEFSDFLKKSCREVLVTCHAFREYMDEEWGAGWRRLMPEIFTGQTSDVTTKRLTNYVGKIDAIVTSPPYPGVHVLYGRWQVQGRRETDLPMWLIGKSPTLKEGDYTLHARRGADNGKYFELLHESMTGCHQVLRSGGYMIQMVGFNKPATQLSQYLDAVKSAGFKEVTSKNLASHVDNRLWREVPGRRWYASNAPSARNTKREVVLVFRAV